MEREAAATSIVLWFEDNPAGWLALLLAQQMAAAEDARLTVLTIAVHERVIGCGRCRQGTAIWNLEMRKMAREDLHQAQALFDASADAEFEVGVGDPVEQITATATSQHATTIVLPWQRNRRLDPPHRRNVAQRLAAACTWQVIVAPEPGRNHQAALLKAP